MGLFFCSNKRSKVKKIKRDRNPVCGGGPLQKMTSSATVNKRLDCKGIWSRSICRTSVLFQVFDDCTCETRVTFRKVCCNLLGVTYLSERRNRIRDYLPIRAFLKKKIEIKKERKKNKKKKKKTANSKINCMSSFIILTSPRPEQDKKALNTEIRIVSTGKKSPK